MANADHISWLLEGVECWNARRQGMDFVPDFEGADIYASFQHANRLDEQGYIPLSGMNLNRANFKRTQLSNSIGLQGADLRNADLGSANLEDSEMANSKFEGARLVGTELGGTNLHASVFRRVTMASTRFAGANLSQADFTGTEFNNAYLQDANLSYAKLPNADLRFAILMGADLQSAQPWQAKLYEDCHGVSGPDQQLATNSSINSVAELINECRGISCHQSDRVLYFRGESKIEGGNGQPWKLEPSLMRDPALRNSERNMLLELMSRRPEDFSNANS